MTRAFKCDKCDEFSVGTGNSFEIFKNGTSTFEAELCDSCTIELEDDNYQIANE